MTNSIYIICIISLLLLASVLALKLYNEIAKTPVFFDSVEVRQVISEIKGCHEAILVVANRLTHDTGIQSERKKEDS